MLPVRTSGRRVPNSTRKPEVADDIIRKSRERGIQCMCANNSRMSTQCVREGAGVHCGLTMGTLPDRVPVLPVETTRTRYPKKMLPDSALFTIPAQQ